jgi:CHAT domain-containing protein
MNALRRILYLVILLAVFESPSGQNTPRYLTLFKEAEALYYDDNTSDTKDSIALATYLKVIALHPGNADSIFWVSQLKAGIYLQTAGKFDAAIPYFKKAISLYGTVPAIGEEHFYQPNLYLGNSYYSQSMLDSAVYYYKQSETIANKHPDVEGIERLYNTLGAVNYESGDYQQSKIYFEKALQVALRKLKNTDPLVINYKNNLASSLRKLKDFGAAMTIFEELLKYNVNRDEILHNIASICLEQGRDSLAVAYLQKVKYNNQNKFNDLAVAYGRLNRADSSLAYLKKAADLNTHVNGARKNIEYAITCRNLGDYYSSIKNYDSAIIRYQQAIVQLVFDFDEDDIRLNPSAFNGQYSVNELFGALSAKARTFTIRYQLQHNKNDLLASLYAYDALYKLADYVIRSYNSDEARLLLNNRKHLSHNEPIENALKLFEQTGDSVYLRHAFRFDEKNKATLLALQLQESGSRMNADIPIELTDKEKRLKQELTKLQLTSGDKNDSALQVALIDRQIQLSDLHKTFDQYPGYNNMKFIDNTIDVRNLQKIIPDDYAVLSFHLGDTSLLGFLITPSKFRYVYENIDSTFRTTVRKLYNVIQVTDQNVNAQVDQLTDSLYKKLILPFANDIADVDRLMIIPDDELSYLPFELLGDSGKSKLISKYAITYNYSCSLLQQKNTNYKHAPVLAMAPFIKSLPASEMEIQNIRGDKIAGKNATKDKFIASAKNYPVIHLATHARTNDSIPARSFIEFYRDDSTFTSSRLFSNEIAGLGLDNVNLVILSACETGTGQLVKGEGLMSLTRAFSYAGCRNTIASLWKADDKSTAEISGHLHQYIDNGESFADALQKAKMDYLGEATGRLRLPAYWAHLRLIGSFEQSKSGNVIYLIIGSALLIAIIAIIFLSRRRSSP